MPIALFVLALSAFAIGTTEFVIMGLLPDVSRSLDISIPSAGWLISGYALGVAIGAPIMALLTARLARKRALLMLMGIFIIGNVLCAVAPDYGFLMIARVITSLCHGAFFGIGSVAAANLVAPNRRAQAVSLMFTGLTLANVLGVPLGTGLGQAAGWRSPFWAVAVIGVMSLLGLWRVLPVNKNEPRIDLLSEIGGLKSIGVHCALLTTTLFSAAMFALFTYIAPMLEQITHVSPRTVTWTLFVIGIGLTVGNYIGGRMADASLGRTLILAFIGMVLTSVAFFWTSVGMVGAIITLALWGIVTFGAVPALQINVMTFGKDAPNLIATLNIGAFNIGNALGAWVGGTVIARTHELHYVPIAAAGLAICALLATLQSLRIARSTGLAVATGA
ncbi:arabinose transporter permease [Robbsia andropogonis]|uniref:Arabinose transporter permease n=1 Tax=Robbsia andropogonis TaxID=28092 RepID=A0A0F5K3A4_9BURK|nr:MFS transporter [Robbsia andropogonis]KKB64435.1 arabinose transporter permease [Robbsia andropogonis]MCP1118969.1 MFS transporter [Robbsia andropogonis]MCP1128679.1 MFS transporter [Robbsia andropogonis]